MMLMILGYYNPIINAITGFIKALSAGDFNAVLTICGSLVPFGLGVVIGIFAIAIKVACADNEYLTDMAMLIIQD